MAASENRLGYGHELMTELIIARMEEAKSGRKQINEDGSETVVAVPLSSAEVQAFAKFFKDNNITCAPDIGNKMGELKERLKEREAAAGDLPDSTKAELQEALRSSGFLGVH